MNKKIIIFGLIGLILVATFVLALPSPISIPNGFNLVMPNLPSVNGQRFGICSYDSDIVVDEIKVWNNYAEGLQNRVEYTFVINSAKCSKGFVGNVTYLINPVGAIQQDFETQILNAIQQPVPEQQPIATGVGS